MAMIDLLNAAKDKVDAEDMDRAMANEDTNKKLRELIVAANEEMRTKLTDKTTLSGLGDLAAELGAGEDLIAAASAGIAATLVAAAEHQNNPPTTPFVLKVIVFEYKR